MENMVHQEEIKAKLGGNPIRISNFENSIEMIG